MNHALASGNGKAGARSAPTRIASAIVADASVSPIQRLGYTGYGCPCTVQLTASVLESKVYVPPSGHFAPSLLAASVMSG